jgi:hypothetical protein
VVSGLDFFDGNNWICYLELDRPAERQASITFKQQLRHAVHMAVNDQTSSTFLHVPFCITETKFKKTKNTQLNEPIEVRIHLNYPIKDRCAFLLSGLNPLNRYCIYVVKTEGKFVHPAPGEVKFTHMN